MPYGETKVYFDGSHYIAIPHTEKPYKRRPKKIEEVITVADDGKTLAPVEAKAESPSIVSLSAFSSTTVICSSGGFGRRLRGLGTYGMAIK